MCQGSAVRFFGEFDVNVIGVASMLADTINACEFILAGLMLQFALHFRKKVQNLYNAHSMGVFRVDWDWT